MAAVQEPQCFLGELREEKNFGHRTWNYYVQAFEQFCSWLVSKRRLATNPVVDLPRLNCETDVRRKRRALRPEEFGKLVQSARSSTEMIQCYDGETRSRIYILSYMTGLRRSELASLTPASFKLDDKPATLTVEATISKHRRKETLPVHPDLVVMRREWLAEMEPHEYLFPNPCQHIVSISGDFGGQRDALDVTDSHSEEAGSDDASPCALAPCGAKKQKRASEDSDAQKWRRRESHTRVSPVS